MKVNFINIAIEKTNYKTMENILEKEKLFNKNFYFPYSKIIQSIRIGGWTKEVIERKRNEKKLKTEDSPNQTQNLMSFLFTIPSKEKKSKTDESLILEV